jgi:hypothetical protein
VPWARIETPFLKIERWGFVVWGKAIELDNLMRTWVMRKRCLFVSTLCVLFLFSSASANEYPNDHFMYYWKKGNNGQSLSILEFTILMTQLEERMKAFRKAFSAIDIGAGGFNYRTGKTWEIQLDTDNEQLDFAFKFLEKVNAAPNQIRYSLGLFVVLNGILRTAYDFARIDAFDKHLNNTHIELWAWITAFEKAHLSALAYAKDGKVDLYPLKK